VESLLSTKLYIPRPRAQLVLRPRLIARLNEGLRSTPGLTILSAPAGFGKTTLLSEWIDQRTEVQGNIHPSRVAWLSLDAGDNDPARFLMYLVAAMQPVALDRAEEILQMLQTPQPPPLEAILTPLLNALSIAPEPFVLVLDDYHLIDSRPVDQTLTFLLEHLPPRMHMVIATREDPDLPLARLRVRRQLTELRAADLRFTFDEAAEFLNQGMGLSLPPDGIAALEARTEGWIAGLQLAALSMQGQPDSASFIQSFTGSHRFIMDYLVEEVLQRQPEPIQHFLLHTSILDRLCGPLCDAVLLDPSLSSQRTLEYLERANLFLIPLDSERRWYRYHHLFADLLRQRLGQGIASSPQEAERRLNELHVRASQWFEDNSLQLEAFKHAAAAHDIDRAERLIDGRGIPLHFSGGVAPILEWLESLPKPMKNARPSLWWRHAAMLLINGQTAGVAENLQAAEAALAHLLGGAEPDAEARKLIGRIAAAAATLALTRYDVNGMLLQSRRALEHLEPDNLVLRSNAHWTLGFAYTILGDRLAARQAFTEGIALSQAGGAMFQLILATIGLAYIQELDNELHQAAETYRRVLQWVGDKPQQIINEVHLGLGRILYEWNDLDAAEQHTQQSLHLARQYETVIDRFVIGEVFLARLKLARGDLASAAAILAKTDEAVRQHNFVQRMPEVAAAQVLTFLRQGNLAAAAQLAETHNLPLSLARVHLAQGDLPAALAILDSFRSQVDTRGWKDDQLKAAVLRAVAHHLQGDRGSALQSLEEALGMAEPGGFIRIFVDEGTPMKELLTRMKNEGSRRIEYVHRVLAAFEKEDPIPPSSGGLPSLVEPLSQRELEVLQLIAQGLSNDEIGKQLYLALDTVKGHNRRIFDKLQVQRRTEAVARARELGLL
jgi:LuxR family maltose regulon positive regulatory protein